MRPPRDTEVERAFAQQGKPLPEKRSGAPDQQPKPDDETRARSKPQAASAQVGPCSMHDAARSEPESAEASEAKRKKRPSKPLTTSKPRVACLLVPALSLAAEMRAEPELRGRPFAIASAPGPRGEVLACSPEAERAGVRIGSGVVHARAACAALSVRVLSPAKERAAREALRDAALACAPRAELAPTATGFYAAEAAVFVDARGVGALYRSEAGFAAALALHAERLGLPAMVAIADTRGTALIAARLLASEARSEPKASGIDQQRDPNERDGCEGGSASATAHTPDAVANASRPAPAKLAQSARSEPKASDDRERAANERAGKRSFRAEDRASAIASADRGGRERKPASDGAGAAGAQRGGVFEAERSSQRHGSERSSQTTVLPPGGDAAFLAPLALDLLNPEDALADALSRFGLRRVGDLLRVPERALLNRLGPALLPLLALARGEDASPPPRAPDAACFEEGSELEAPLAQQEPLLFVLRGLLARLAERLACRGLAFGALTLSCELEGGGRDVRTLGLAAPTLDVRAVLRLVALALEARPPSAAIDAIRVTTEGAVLRGDQLDFFAPAGPSPAALSRTLAELAALCGTERVGAPALADAHRPDAFALAPFALHAAAGATRERARGGERGATAREHVPGARAESAVSTPSTSTRTSTERLEDAPRAARALPASSALASGLAVRALRPPLAAAVRSARGAPHWVQSALANGEVLRCAGPWRTTGQWWSDERYAFDHYDVLTSDGNVVRLRRDLLHERWEIDGVFD